MGPLEHIIAAKAVAFREAMTFNFVAYMEQVVNNMRVLANRLMENGIGIISGGTDNHLALIDLRDLDLTGKELQERLERIDITTNKNTVPFETRSPFITSGLRIGTAAITTRGLVEDDMFELADIITRVIDGNYDEEEERERVHKLVKDKPLFKW